VSEFHTHHQHSLAQTFVNRTFQIPHGPCDGGCLHKFRQVRVSNHRFEPRNDHAERLGRGCAEPLDLNLTNRQVNVLLGLTGLDLCEAAVHEQFCSRDVAAVVGCQKHDRLRNFVGCSEPAERNRVVNHLLALLAHV